VQPESPVVAVVVAELAGHFAALAVLQAADNRPEAMAILPFLSRELALDVTVFARIGKPGR
jgi:hypothetical protein